MSLNEQSTGLAGKQATSARTLMRIGMWSVILMTGLSCSAADVPGAFQATPVSAQQSPPSSDTASRIQGKIGRVGARATKLRESGGDVAPIQEAMQQVDRLLKSGDYVAAERILDDLLKKFGETVAPAAPPATTSAKPAAVTSRDVAQCDPARPMTVSSAVTVSNDCTIGGDLTVSGKGVLLFDYSQRSGARVVVNGNVVVKEDATLQVNGRAGGRAVFVIDNQFSQQRSMTSSERGAIKFANVEFRTQKSVDRSKGSVYTAYDARGNSSFEATGSMLVDGEAWLLTNLHDSATLTVASSQRVPTEIYIHDASIARIRGADTRTGIWLDAQGAKGSLTLPDVTRPFTWRLGAGAGLNVGWLLQVDDAQPGLGIEIRPGSALTIVGNGTRAPATGELKISYFVIGGGETLDGLKSGMQNRKISDRLTLNNVQLGPIAWQIYAGDNANLTISNSTINEIGIFGRNARVGVDRSVLQLAVLAVMAAGSSLTINSSVLWNQSIEAASQAQVTINDSEVHGSLFHARNPDARISIKGGRFFDNPGSCTQATMVNIATGEPRCNPFRPAGPPRSTGSGRVECAGTQGCGF